MAGVLYFKTETCSAKPPVCCGDIHTEQFRLQKALHPFRCSGCQEKIETGEIYVQHCEVTPAFELGARWHLECLYADMERNPDLYVDWQRSSEESNWPQPDFIPM